MTLSLRRSVKVSGSARSRLWETSNFLSLSHVQRTSLGRPAAEGMVSNEPGWLLAGLPEVVWVAVASSGSPGRWESRL